jgi:hypothetical protein
MQRPLSTIDFERKSNNEGRVGKHGKQSGFVQVVGCAGDHRRAPWTVPGPRRLADFPVKN